MEARGLEPLTLCLQSRCATNCATPPWCLTSLYQRFAHHQILTEIFFVRPVTAPLTIFQERGRSHYDPLITSPGMLASRLDTALSGPDALPLRNFFRRTRYNYTGVWREHQIKMICYASHICEGVPHQGEPYHPQPRRARKIAQKERHRLRTETIPPNSNP